MPLDIHFVAGPAARINLKVYHRTLECQEITHGRSMSGFGLTTALFDLVSKLLANTRKHCCTHFYFLPLAARLRLYAITLSPLASPG